MIKKTNHKIIETSRMEVLLEKIQEDFQAFGESLDFVKNDIHIIKGDINSMNRKLETIEIKLDNKVDQEKFNVLEGRVRSLEKIVYKH